MCHTGSGGGASTGSCGGTNLRLGIGGGTRGRPVPRSAWGSMATSSLDDACASSAEGQRATWEPQVPSATMRRAFPEQRTVAAKPGFGGHSPSGNSARRHNGAAPVCAARGMRELPDQRYETNDKARVLAAVRRRAALPRSLPRLPNPATLASATSVTSRSAASQFPLPSSCSSLSARCRASAASERCRTARSPRP